jgi:hypothetical protein
MTSLLNSDRFLPIDESLEGDKFRDMVRERLRVDGIMAVARHPPRKSRFSDSSLILNRVQNSISKN